MKTFGVPIRFKVLGLLVILSTVVSAVVSQTLLSYFDDDKATYIQDLNADIAVNTAESVDLLMRLYRQRVARLIETFNESEDPGKSLASFFETSTDLIHLAIYDETRNNVLGMRRAGLVEDAGIDIDGFQEARKRLTDSPAYLRSRGFVVRNSSLSPELLTFSMSVPFYAASYDQWFAFRAEFLAEPLLRAVQRSPGFTTYIVEKDGTLFAHPEADRMAARESYASRLVVQEVLANLGRVAAGTGEFEETDGLMLASYAVVRGAGLGVLVERPKADAYLAADRLAERSTKAAALVIVIAGIFSIFLARAFTGRLMELSEAARRLEKGQFDVHLEPSSSDELGDLARSFNMAAEGLKERDTKLKIAYEQLLQSEKLAGFGKFSAGIAHEIKNPLTGIIGFAQIIAKKFPEGDPSRRHLGLIEKEAKRCKTILDNLLKFTRKEGFKFQPVRMHAQLTEVAELLVPQLGVSKVELTTRLDASSDLIRGDANQLQQVFMNLCMNAIDALEETENPQLEVSTRDADDGCIEVRISDNGTGIPEAVLRKVFDPFFTTKEQGKGTGLGLSVSYGIVTNHGGRISVDNRPEGGAEFKIVLPPASSATYGQERREKAAGESGQNKAAAPQAVA